MILSVELKSKGSDDRKKGYIISPSKKGEHNTTLELALDSGSKCGNVSNSNRIIPPSMAKVLEITVKDSHSLPLSLGLKGTMDRTETHMLKMASVNSMCFKIPARKLSIPIPSQVNAKYNLHPGQFH